jgi:hypothetical protein
MEDEVILKYMNGEPMTLEESALALHMYDNAHGIKSKKPMTKMGFLKLEQRIMMKLRKACEDAGLSKAEAMEILQSLSKPQRRAATVRNSGSAIE